MTRVSIHAPDHTLTFMVRIQWSPLMEGKMPVTVSMPAASRGNKRSVLTEGWQRLAEQSLVKAPLCSEQKIEFCDVAKMPIYFSN